jgi:hypothetical protein
VLVTTAIVVGCGDDEPATPTATTTSEPASRDRAATTPPEDVEEDEDAVVTPTPAALASKARLERLVAQYAPVTRRVNFLVTAETLREDAVASGAGETLERYRSGPVRIELRRMERVLQQARPRVAEVAVLTVAEKSVQALMLEAIDARLRALDELELALDAHAAEDTPDSEVERLDEQWRASWDESLRAAREATTAMQLERARLGLEPGPEDGIR